MSDITPIDSELSKLSKEYTEARKKREHIWKLRTACCFRLCQTEDNAKLKILEAALKNIEARCQDIEDMCHMLDSIYNKWLNPPEVDNCYLCGYNHADKEGWIINAK
jgi:hypothetical protein